MDIKNELNIFFQECIKSLAPDNDFVTAEFDKTPNKLFGDLSTNFVMQNFVYLKANFEDLNSPFALAEYLSSQLMANKPSFVKAFKAEKPGFINVYLDYTYIAQNALRDTIGLGLTQVDKKIVVEHTSVNPNKAMHIGHLRNAVLGDFFANLYKKFGATVEVQNYIDDTGVQVADTVNALGFLGADSSGYEYFDDFCWDKYAQINKLYETNKDLLEKREQILHELEKGNNETAMHSSEYVQKILNDHIALMKRFGINYDLLVYESDIIKTGLWNETHALLEKSSNFVLSTEGKQEGCWVLKSTDGKYEDKIFIRKNGTIVYTAKDTAYHLWKFGLVKSKLKFKQFSDTDIYRTSVDGFDGAFGHANTIVNVIDERQTYPQQMVKQALESLGFANEAEHLMHIQYGVVNLSPASAQKLGITEIPDKLAYSMSGRKGIGIKARDLLENVKAMIIEERKKANATIDPMIAEKIAIGSIKHYLLKFNAFTEIVFDLETAISIKGNTGPYLMYSFARANSILDKIDSNKDLELVINSFSESESELVSLMLDYKEIVEKAYSDLAPSVFTDYVFRLASAFHLFYENNPILKASDDDYSKRVLLTKKFVSIMRDCLELLGIEPLEKM